MPKTGRPLASLPGGKLPVNAHMESARVTADFNVTIPLFGRAGIEWLNSTKSIRCVFERRACGRYFMRKLADEDDALFVRIKELSELEEPTLEELRQLLRLRARNILVRIETSSDPSQKTCRFELPEHTHHEFNISPGKSNQVWFAFIGQTVELWSEEFRDKWLGNDDT